MLMLYTCYARFAIFCCIFWHTAANDFDLGELYQVDNNDIELIKEGIHSTGLLYIDRYPKVDNMSFTLSFPEEHHMVISVEYLRLSSHCNAFLELSSTFMKIRFCRSTMFHNYAVDTFLFRESPVLLNISMSHLASPPKLELRYTVMSQNLSCDEGHFKCDNDYCILKKFECDGYKNCADGSDEIDAEGKRCSPVHQKQWDAKKILLLVMVILIPMSMIILCTFAACMSYKYGLRK